MKILAVDYDGVLYRESERGSEKGTCSFCKGALLAAMRRLYKERQSPHCTILMGQRLRDRECEFAPNPKYGTVKLKKPLVSIGQCCHWGQPNIIQLNIIKGIR
ncbi:MAG: hypothetical protein IMZ56_00630 [Candidatus Atribacteria bacterium]|nr:hypothetical protein [Candidatus Atribacteria bacterium]